MGRPARAAGDRHPARREAATRPSRPARSSPGPRTRASTSASRWTRATSTTPSTSTRATWPRPRSDDYHSHNTERLGVTQVVDLLESLPAFRALTASIDVLEFSVALVVALMVTGVAIPLLRGRGSSTSPTSARRTSTSPHGGRCRRGGRSRPPACCSRAVTTTSLVVLAGAAVAALVGLVDDLRGLGALTRLAAQVSGRRRRRCAAPGRPRRGRRPARPRRRCRRRLAGGLPQRLQLHGRDQRHLGPDRPGGRRAGSPGSGTTSRTTRCRSPAWRWPARPWASCRGTRSGRGSSSATSAATRLGFGIAGLALVALLAGASWLQALAPLAIYLADTAWTLVDRATPRRDVARGPPRARLPATRHRWLVATRSRPCWSPASPCSSACWPAGSPLPVAAVGALLVVAAYLQPAEGGGTMRIAIISQWFEPGGRVRRRIPGSHRPRP